MIHYQLSAMKNVCEIALNDMHEKYTKQIIDLKTRLHTVTIEKNDLQTQLQKAKRGGFFKQIINFIKRMCMCKP